MKNLLLLIFTLLFSINTFGQVTGVRYLLTYDDATDDYTVSLVVDEGATNTALSKIQSNCQITIVIPSGAGLMITDRMQPTVLGSSNPCNWFTGNQVFGASIMSAYDLYGIQPQLAPTCAYEDLAEGDIVDLFKFNLANHDNCMEQARLYENGLDDALVGMQGANFSNGYTIGGPEQIYKGNAYEGNVEIENFICLGDVLQLENTISGTYSSSDVDVLTVGNDGLITSLAEGNASVTFFDNLNGCQAQPIFFEVLSAEDGKCLSSSQALSLENVKLYPNPANEEVLIELSDAAFTIEVVNILGKKIFTDYTKSNSLAIATSDWRSGIYIVRVKQNGKQSSYKLNVQH